MTTGSTGRAGRRGSVLMETVLVLPLYLTLLGGLFIVGDMLLGRLRLSAVERTYTWLVADRFDDVRPSLHATLQEMVPEDALPAGASRVSVKRTADGTYVENQWLHLAEGAAHLIVDVGWWTGRGNIHQTMYGKDGKPTAFDDAYPLFHGDTQEGRAFVVRRKERMDAVRDSANLKVDTVEGAWNIETVTGDTFVLVGEPGIPIAPTPFPDLPRHSALQPLCE
ncbi:MAG: hypothetical protein FWF84_03170 [Kiritimatiellaeota bacterium]|nr:hypothetical protein [Kiritimatiellota bacterium]